MIRGFVDPGSHPDIQRNGVPRATVLLAQQSLQYAFGSCANRWIEIEVGFGDLPTPEDEARIQHGAEVIAAFAKAFSSRGFERVYLATHIYAPKHEYELYGERFSLARALALHLAPGLVTGPELWEVTHSLWPDGYWPDRRHPDVEVTHAMALYWYIVLAGVDAKLSVMEPVAEIAGVPIPGAGNQRPPRRTAAKPPTPDRELP